MPPWLPRALPEGLAGPSLVLGDASGQSLSAADVASMVLSAALDADLPHATGIGWDVLRDTAIDWLVGQGIRYSELPKVVGRVEAQKLQALSSRHGDARRQELAQVDTLMPALRLEPQG
jgi:hypothetical protein